MALFTSLSTFKPVVLTAAQYCLGCDRKLQVGEEVLAKFVRAENAPRKVETFCLCKDSHKCWEDWDWNYWNPKEN